MRYIHLLIQIPLAILFRVIFVFFSDFRVRGSRNIKHLDRTRGVIFASNHSSQVDSLLVPISLSIFSKLLPMHFVSLEDKFYKRFPIGRYIYGGIFFRLLGAYPVRSGLKNYALSLASHTELLREGRSICIYPEGQIIYGKITGPARGGVAYLAEATGAIIVPVALTDVHDMTFFDFFLMRRRIDVTFGKPVTYDALYGAVCDEIEQHGGIINPEELPRERHKLVAQKLMDIIGEMVHPEATRVPGMSMVSVRETVYNSSH